jgi:Carbamoyltransferase C-terminus
LSGIPSLIDTSFNMHEEPIVNSPKDAVRAFLQGNLDYLAISNFLVVHPQRRSSQKVESIQMERPIDSTSAMIE